MLSDAAGDYLDAHPFHDWDCWQQHAPLAQRFKGMGGKDQPLVDLCKIICTILLRYSGPSAAQPPKDRAVFSQPCPGRIKLCAPTRPIARRLFPDC